MGTTDRDDIPDVPPPSYDDAVNQNSSNLAPPPPNRPQTLGSSHSSSNSTFTSFGNSSASTSSRPPAPRPSNNTNGNGAALASNVNEQSLYSNGNLPFSYPKGYLCSKCKNTGYKTKSGEMCSKCWRAYYLNKHSYNPNSALPFKYPRGFLCEKCENTGTKRKNGKTCKDCWLRFAPRQGGPSVSYSLFSPSPFFGGATTITQVGGPGTARPVAPGDPRIGGTLCGRCRGSGITHFLLDEELCPICHGLGRIVLAQPQWIPQPIPPPGPQMGYPPQGYPPQGYPPPGQNQGYQGYQGNQGNQGYNGPQNYNQGYAPQNQPYKN